MEIKKIMLIRPGIRFPGKRFAPPLGLLYLVSVLRQEFPGQFEIDLVDQALYDLSFEQMREKIRKFSPDVVGFSCLSVEDNELIKLFRIAKGLNPNCLTILGGPHASVFYDHALENANIDIAVIGEGERTFPELIRKLQKDEPIDNVKGIAFKKDGKIILTPPREPIENLDEIPFPAWDKVDFKRYSKEPGPNVYCHSRPWTIIFTSRGCPHHCSYCHNIFGKGVRNRSLDNVLAEIKLLVEDYGIKEIQIVDDIFNNDIARAKEFCDRIIKEGIKIKFSFPSGLRADLTDKELIEKLKQAGCYVITYAVDTASPRLQKIVKRDIDLEKIRQAIQWTNQEGLITHVYSMLGFPGETLDEMEMTIKYAVESGALIGFFLTVVVYPKSELMKFAREVYPNFNFKEWDSASLHYRAEKPFYTKVTGIDIYKIQRDAYCRFFFRPKIIFSILLKLPKNLFFFKTIWRGLELTFHLLYKFEQFLSAHSTPKCNT